MWGGLSFLSPPPRTSRRHGADSGPLQNWELFWPDRTPGLHSKRLHVRKRKPEPGKLRVPTASQSSVAAARSPASCRPCERHGGDAPDLGSRVPRTLQPDPLLPPHTRSEQRILILGGPPLKAVCPHPFLPGLGKTRASGSARPKGARLQC